LNSDSIPAASPAPELTLPKKILYTIIVLIVLFACLWIVGELVLRVVSLHFISYRSSPFRQYDPDLGVSLIPNRHVSHGRGCFHGVVYINRWGFRDRERSLEKSPGEYRIAMLGDSYVEAVHVKPDEVMNIRLEQLLAEKGFKNTAVPAFGIEGLGTAQELVMYRERVRQFHPDLVVVMFALNDVMNNSSTLQPKVYGIHTWFAPYYDLGPDGKLVFRPVESRSLNGLRNFLEHHSLLFYYLERAWLSFDITLYKWQGIPIEWGVFGDPLDPEWQQAWRVTEKVLTLMRDTVEADGAKFEVLILPNFFEIDPDWPQRFEKSEGKIPPAMKVSTYEERLREIAARDHISMGFLAPYFQSYRDAHHLQWPYFSFTCNTHYSAMGHEVTAEAILQTLEEQHLLPPQGEDTAGNPITAELPIAESSQFSVFSSQHKAGACSGFFAEN
jgi:hypothetical protein